MSRTTEKQCFSDRLGGVWPHSTPPQISNYKFNCFGPLSTLSLALFRGNRINLQDSVKYLPHEN